MGTLKGLAVAGAVAVLIGTGVGLALAADPPPGPPVRDQSALAPSVRAALKATDRRAIAAVTRANAARADVAALNAAAIRTGAPAGGALAGAYPNPGLGNGVVQPANIGVVPAVIAAGTAPQTTPAAGDWALLQLPAETVDTSDAFTGGVFTAPVSGLYQVSATVDWTRGAASSFEAAVARNPVAVQNTVTALLYARPANPSGGPLVFTQNLSGLVKLAAGDRIGLTVQWLGGGVGDPAVGGPTTQMSILWEAPAP